MHLSARLFEPHLAKVGVAGSNPVVRSIQVQVSGPSGSLIRVRGRCRGLKSAESPRAIFRCDASLAAIRRELRRAPSAGSALSVSVFCAARSECSVRRFGGLRSADLRRVLSAHVLLGWRVRIGSRVRQFCSLGQTAPIGMCEWVRSSEQRDATARRRVVLTGLLDQLCTAAGRVRLLLCERDDAPPPRRGHRRRMSSQSGARRYLPHFTSRMKSRSCCTEKSWKSACASTFPDAAIAP